MASSDEFRDDEFSGSALAADPWAAVQSPSPARVSPTRAPLATSPVIVPDPQPTVVPDSQPTVVPDPQPTMVPESPDLSSLAVPGLTTPPVFLSDYVDPTPIAGITSSSLREVLRRAQPTDDSAPTLREYLSADALANEYTVVPTAGIRTGSGGSRQSGNRRSRRR